MTLFHLQVFATMEDAGIGSARQIGFINSKRERCGVDVAVLPTSFHVRLCDKEVAGLT